MSAAELESLDFTIGMKPDPQQEALRALREHQQAAGMVFDDPDAPVPPDEKGRVLLADRDEEFGSGYLGR